MAAIEAYTRSDPTSLSLPVERALYKAKITRFYKRLPAAVRQKVLDELTSEEESCSNRTDNIKGLCKSRKRTWSISNYLVMDDFVIADIGLAFQRLLPWLLQTLHDKQRLLQDLTNPPLQASVDPTVIDSERPEQPPESEQVFTDEMALLYGEIITTSSDFSSVRNYISRRERWW